MGTRRRGGLAVACAILAVVTAACSDDPDPTEPRDDDVLDVSVDTSAGTCMLVEEDFPAEVETLPIIDCAQPHTHEIYATVTNDADVYPGSSELESWARVACLEQFEPFVGIGAFDSELLYTWLLPTLDGWNDHDDHDALCVLQDPTKPSTVGSLRDSRR